MFGRNAFAKKVKMMRGKDEPLGGYLNRCYRRFTYRLKRRFGLVA